MARTKSTNGVIDTLERLMGQSDDSDRKLLTKYINLGIFKEHMSSGRGHIFKRSTECDNLIKNVLALDAVLGSPNQVCAIINKRMGSQERSQKIAKRREDLNKRFKAYGYWLSRLQSLETQLGDIDLEKDVLEDVLIPDLTDNWTSPGSPFALRAVKLLEKLEEEGRHSKLSPEKLSEKAWALYRLGLEEQARELCQEITTNDPAQSDAWLLLAVDAQRQQKDAQREWVQYLNQRELADPMSSQETWAEEMQEEASLKLDDARRRERNILFPALLHWPEEPKQTRSSYRFPDTRHEVRKGCIDGLFRLLKPGTQFNVDRRKSYKINGLEPEYLLTQELKGYPRRDETDGPGYQLTDVQLQVAQLLCSELDREADQFFRIWPATDDRDSLELKLLHVRFVLGLPGYEEARVRWLTFLRGFRRVDYRKLMRPDLYDAFMTHLSRDGLPALATYFDSITSQVRKVHSQEYHDIHLNLLRKAYDHAFARGKYIDSIAFAKAGGQEAISMDVDAPSDLCCKLDDVGFNSLKPKFWKYLELRAAAEVSVDEINHKAISESLLSVPNPDEFFSNESEYMVGYQDEFDDWYETAYGDSILENGQMARSLTELLDTGLLTSDESEQALIILDHLETLRSDEDTPNDNHFW